MPYWKPLIVDGVAIDLGHFETFEFETRPTGSQANATVRVMFGSHCFSEAFDAAAHTASLPRTHVSAHETRSFDRERYELGKSLRGHVRNFPGQRIAQTRTGTLVKVALSDGRDYGIFFTLGKLGPSLCELFVVTAYPLDGGRQVAVTGEMRFNLIVAKVLEGRRPKFPNGRF